MTASGAPIFLPNGSAVNLDASPRGPMGDGPGVPLLYNHYFVRGLPVTQGSMKAIKGRIMHENPELARWRGQVFQVTREVLAGAPALEIPVSVELVFFLMTKGRRRYFNAPGGLCYAAGIGRDDLDKHVRAVLDALTTAGAWLDDSLAVEITARKYYADPPRLPPGVRIGLAPALLA